MVGEPMSGLQVKREDLRVVAVAIKTLDGVVHTLPPPARHHDVIHALARAGMSQIEHCGPMEDSQGFLLNNGQFCRRAPAKLIAERGGQLIKRAMNLHELYSEDVW